MADAPEYDDGDERLKRDLGRALKDLLDNAPEYERRQKLYDGTLNEVIAHPKLKALLEKYTEGNFRVNIAAVPADALIDRLDLSGLTTGDTTIDGLLKTLLWDANELDDDADDFHLRACYLGDYYAIAEVPDPDAPDDAPNDSADASTAGASSVIELHGKHPTNARILYSRENSRSVDFGIFRWQAGEQRWRVNIYYDDLTVQWVAEQADGTKPEQYKLIEIPDAPGEPDVIENDWGFPMFHFRPDSKPYGTPVNRGAYGPQDSVTKLVATHMGTVDYIGYPQRYALLDPNAETGDDITDDFNANGTIDVDDTEGSTTTGSKLDATPGSAWLLSGVKEVGQFDAADPKQLLEPVDFYAAKAAAFTRTPPRLFGIPEAGNDPSGESRRREDAPLVKHAKKLQGTYGRTWRQIGAYALEVWKVGAGKVVSPTWQPAELASDTEGIELVAAKIKVGVPPHQALIEAGYEPEQVEKWLPDGADDVFAASPSLLIDLATALSALGTAKTLGAVSSEQITELFARYLPAGLGSTEPAPVLPLPARIG